MTSVKRQAVTIEKSPKSSIKHTHHHVGTDQTVDSDSFYLSHSLGFEDSIARDARVLSLTFPSCLMGTMSVRLGPVCLVAIKCMSQAKNSIKNICFRIL